MALTIEEIKARRAAADQQQEREIKNAVAASAQTTPAKHAQGIKVAEETGMDPFTAEFAIQEFDLEGALKRDPGDIDFGKMVTEDPVTASMMSIPDRKSVV